MRSFVKIGQIFKQMKWKDTDSTMNSQGCFNFSGEGVRGGKQAKITYASIHTMMCHASTNTTENSSTRQAAYIIRLQYRNRLSPYISTNKARVLNI